MDEAQVRILVEQLLVDQRLPKELPSDPTEGDITQYRNGVWEKLNVRYGKASISWSLTGSKSSNTTVTHGMSDIPSMILAIVVAANSETEGISCNVNNVTSTTFQVYGQYVAGTAPGTQARDVYWIAIR